MGFLDALDGILDEKKPEPALVAVKPSEPSEPYCPPHQEKVEFDEPDPNAPPAPYDQFRDMVEAALVAEGVDVSLELRRRYDPTAGNVQEHDWASQREALFADEKYQFKCVRCDKWLHVGREQTMNEAMSEQDVDPNCARQMVKEVQEC